MTNPLARLLEERVGASFEFGGYRFRRAEDEDERELAYRLRWEVFSEEGFIERSEMPGGRFRDDFDAVSTQLLVYGESGVPVGTTRFVLPSERGFPTEYLFDFDPPDVPRHRLGEYGRLAIRAEHRGGLRAPMLGLLKAVFELMLEHRITHVYAFMPPKLIASYTALGCVPVPLVTHGLSAETIRRRHVMRHYFDRQAVEPVLFDLREMMWGIGANPERPEMSEMYAGESASEARKGGRDRGRKPGIGERRGVFSDREA